MKKRTNFIATASVNRLSLPWMVEKKVDCVQRQGKTTIMLAIRVDCELLVALDSEEWTALMVQCLPFRDYFIWNQHNLTHISQGLWTGLAYLVEPTLAHLWSFTRSGFFCPWQLSGKLDTTTVIFIYYIWNKDSNIQKFLYTWSLWLLLSMTLSLQL